MLLRIRAKCCKSVDDQYLQRPPTLVATRLYVRDRKRLMALDLGQ
jgi:hypothetical protein